MSRFKFAIASFFLFISGFWIAGCDSSDPLDEGVPVTVMTRNLYLGGDISRVVGAQSPQQVPILVAGLWETIQESNFAERARTLAAEIAEAEPHLVGLQEVSLFRIQSPSDFLAGVTEPNATEVALNFLDILLDELSTAGVNYRVISQVENADVELPALLDATQAIDLRLTDRDVILAREDVEVTSHTERHFEDRLTIPLGGPNGPRAVFTRGYTMADVIVNGVEFTFVNSHLEVGGFGALVQALQGQELVETLASVDGPVVLVGDFNSAADGSTTETYSILTDSFEDAYAPVRSDDPGYTCCQAEDLQNTTSNLSERVDLILYRGDVGVESAERVGADADHRTPSGLWPSDHAGVVASLLVAN